MLTNCSQLTDYTCPVHLARKFGYSFAGDGYCMDWIYLPEGSPELLSSNHTFYDKDRIQECMNRCVNAAEQGLIGSQSTSWFSKLFLKAQIGNKAFYIKNSNKRCGCSYGSCSSIRTSLGYTSYHIHGFGKC